jgi:alpha-N-acetylglucosaminidase
MLHRLVGDRADEINAQLLPRRSREDFFSVSASGGRVELRGTSGVAVASALRHYLAAACGTQITRDSANPTLPVPLPDLDLVQRSSPWLHRYHLNFCTFSYTAAFWDWERWEREIDLMALQGINLPLCVVGNEGVWLSVFQQFGLSTEEALSFIGGAAFLPFTWHGSVRHHGGPLTKSWVEAHVELAQNVISRQRSLGMKPVLPGFAGYVPAGLSSDSSFPVEWMGVTHHVLGPADPFFTELGLAHMREQERLFGTDGYYAIDPFIEGIPVIEKGPDEDPVAVLVAQRARQITQMLQTRDPHNVWVLMSWPFSWTPAFWQPHRIKAVLDELPPAHTLIQDTWAEHRPVWHATHEFQGRPWLWTMLHSFGGRPGMHGALDAVATQPFRIRHSNDGTSLSGLGLAPESLDHDPVVYELMADAVWTSDAIDLESWVRTYARLRYGRSSASIDESWRILLYELYARSELSGPVHSIIMSRPRVDDDLASEVPLNLTEPFSSDDVSLDLVRAWDLLIDDATAHGATPGMERDIVDLGLEVLTRTANALHGRVVTAFRTCDRKAFTQASVSFLDCFDAVDTLAACYSGYRLSGWLRDAGTWARADEERTILQRDALLIVTSWFTPGHKLQDYAGKHWTGLVSGYYGPRWRRWLAALESALDGRQLDQASFAEELTTFETTWQSAPSFVEAPEANAVDTAARIRDWHHRTLLQLEVGGVS